MLVMEAQEFVDIINRTIPMSYAVAQFDEALQRDLLIISTRISPQIKIIYRKAFNLMPDGTVFFDVLPLEKGSWLLETDLIIKHENIVYFDNKISNDATQFFKLVDANVDHDILRYYQETDNEIRVAQTLLPLKKYA